MAKIIKHGNKYQYAECSGCGTIFGFLEKEIVKKSGGDDYFGEAHFYNETYVVCPECDKRLYIKKILDGGNILKSEDKIRYINEIDISKYL